MTICVNHQKGGVGKSTISWNLAIELSKKAQVEIVDLDVQQTITLNSLVRNKIGLGSLNIRTFKNTESFKKYIDTDNDSKIILIDTGAYDSNLNRFATVVADVVITPVSNSTVELQGLKTYEKIISDINASISSSNEKVKPYVVLNNVDPRTKNFKELKAFIESTGTFNILQSIVCRRTDFVSSITNGKSAKEFSKDSKSAKEIDSLLNEIKTILSI